MRLRSALSIVLCLGAACAGPSATGDQNAENPPASPKSGPNAAALHRALEWLKDHQDEDGRWDADGFMRHDTEGDPCNGPGSSVHAVGVTGLALLAESHISIHTWPENGYAAVDVFTCGDHTMPEKACEVLCEELAAGRHALRSFLRETPAALGTTERMPAIPIAA